MIYGGPYGEPSDGRFSWAVGRTLYGLPARLVAVLKLNHENAAMKSHTQVPMDIWGQSKNSLYSNWPAFESNAFGFDAELEQDLHSTQVQPCL